MVTRALPRRQADPGPALVVANTAHGPEADTSNAYGRGAPHDHLDDPVEAASFLRRQGLGIPTGAPRGEQLAAMREVRAAAHALARGDEAEWRRRTARLLQRATYRLRVDGALVPDADGWEAFVAALLPSLLALHDVRDRVKVCGNPECVWLFLDRSKNRSREWCEMASCGNLMKVRRHRARSRKK